MDVCCFDNDEAAMELHGLFKFIKYFGSQQAAAEAIDIKQQALVIGLCAAKYLLSKFLE